MKTLYLIRGISGSGKTTLAHNLSQGLYDVAVISADDFFTDVNGVYHFDPEKLKAAHEHCQKRCENNMEVRAHNIVVHNTFTRQWELNPYKEFARKYGYTIFEIICNNDFGNIHNVPIETINKQKERFEYR